MKRNVVFFLLLMLFVACKSTPTKPEEIPFEEGIPQSNIETETVATEELARESENPITEELASESEIVATEELARETESLVTEEVANETESTTTEELARETENVATEELANETENPATEELANETESTTTEEITIESETTVAEEPTSELESTTTEELAREAESPATEEPTSEAENSATEEITSETESTTTEELAGETENPITEEFARESEAETAATEELAREAENPVTEELANETENPATEKIASESEAETAATEELAREAENPATEEPTSEVESLATEEFANEDESPATEELAREAENPATEELANETESTTTEELATETESPITEELAREVENPATEELANETETVATEEFTENQFESLGPIVLDLDMDIVTDDIAVFTEEIDPATKETRSLSMKLNQYLDIEYPGQGWAFDGDIEDSGIISYFGKKLNNSNTVFTLRSRYTGSTLVKFSKTDAITNTITEDILKITIIDESANPNERLLAPTFVPKRIRKIEPENNFLPQELENDSLDDSFFDDLPVVSLSPQKTQKSIVDEPLVSEVIIPTDTKKNTALQNQNINLLLAKAKTALQGRKYPEALKYINDYFSKASENLDEALYVQGQIYEKMLGNGNIEKALSSYQKLVEQYPYSKWFKNAQNRIHYLNNFYFQIR